jgi:alanine dehydrogenase
MNSPTTFGVMREILPRERRVALTPDGTERLIAAGHAVIMETGAGKAAGFDDDDYRAMGTTIALSNREVSLAADVLVKVHGPGPSEVDLLPHGGTIAGFLHLSNQSAKGLRTIIREKELNAVAFELLEENDGTRPVLEAVSAIGGRVAVMLAAQSLLASGGGSGRLLGGAPGVPPLNVVIIGAGAAGEAAAREAQRMGARVSVLDRDSQALTRVARRIDGILTAVASRRHLDRAVATADVLICAVATAGRPAPKIVSRRQVRSMPSDAMIIDMSVDEGGCCETSRPHTQEESYDEEGVRHLCVPNLPSEVAQTASIAFTNAILPFLLAMGESSVNNALSAEPPLYRGAVYIKGCLRNSVVAELTGEQLGE